MRFTQGARTVRAYLGRAVVLPAFLGLLLAGMFALVDAFGAVMASWDSPQPGLGWLSAGATGEGYLAAAAFVVLLVRAVLEGRRHGAALTAPWNVVAWGIVVLEAGWFALTIVMVRRSG